MNICISKCFYGISSHIWFLILFAHLTLFFDIEFECIYKIQIHVISIDRETLPFDTTTNRSLDNVIHSSSFTESEKHAHAFYKHKQTFFTFHRSCWCVYKQLKRRNNIDTCFHISSRIHCVSYFSICAVFFFILFFWHTRFVSNILRGHIHKRFYGPKQNAINKWNSIFRVLVKREILYCIVVFRYLCRWLKQKYNQQQFSFVSVSVFFIFLFCFALFLISIRGYNIE